MVSSRTNGATSDANVTQSLGRVHPKLISSSIGQTMVLVGSTGQVKYLQSSNDCSQHVFGSLFAIGGNQGTNRLNGEVVDLGCPEQPPQQHNYTHSS